MRRLIAALVMAVVFTACGYPFNPTPRQCAMERHPPPCGCPTTADPSGFYVEGKVYWPHNDPPLDRCVG